MSEPELVSYEIPENPRLIRYHSDAGWRSKIKGWWFRLKFRLSRKKVIILDPVTREEWVDDE